MIADAVYGLVTGDAEPNTEKFIQQPWGKVGQTMLTVRHSWCERNTMEGRCDEEKKQLSTPDFIPPSSQTCASGKMASSSAW
jgi:hypothetical protein